MWLVERREFRLFTPPLIVLKVVGFRAAPPLGRWIDSFFGSSAANRLAGRQAFRYLASPLIFIRDRDYGTSPPLSVDTQLF